MGMKHRYAPFEFSLEVQPLSSGAMERVLHNNKTDVASLFDFIAPLLFDTPGFRAGKFWFTLLNVTCTFTKFSYGISPPPPENVRPVTATWHFTFALSHYGYGSNFKANKRSMRGVQAMAWGQRRSNEFITISTTHYQASQMRIAYDSFTPEWLYYLIGMMTKSFALYSKFFQDGADFSTLYLGKNQNMLRSQYHMMPIYNLVNRQPYHVWVFNRHVWSLGAKLISVNHITPETILYMCKNIRQVGTLSAQVEEKLVDKIHESITDTMQRRSRNEAPTEIAQVLYTALVNRGKIPDTDELAWLSQAEEDIDLPMGSYKNQILELLYA